MDKLLELLNGDPLIELGVTVWNWCCALVYSLIGVSPVNLQSTAWNHVTHGIYPIFLALGVSLMSLFFLIGFIRESVDIRHAMTLENSILMFVRLVIANAIVVSALIWIPRFLGWAAGMVGQIAGLNSGGLGALDADALTENHAGLVDSLNGAFLFGWVIALLFFLVAVVCGLSLVLAIYKRFINILMLIPFAPVALSTAAGGRGLSNSAISWVKEFLSLCFEVVVIAMALSIASYFITTNIFTSILNLGSGGIARYTGNLTAIFSMVMVLGAVKGSDKLIKRALGL